MRKRKFIDYSEDDDDYSDDNHSDNYSDNYDSDEHKIIQEINKMKPKLADIIHSDINLSDKAELYQLYKVYETYKLSEEKISLQKKIFDKLEYAKNKYQKRSTISIEEKNRIEKELENLERYNEGQELKYSIVNLNTNIDNKRVIYGKYKRLLNIDTNSEEYHKLKHWLDWAISLPYDTYKVYPFNKRELTAFLQKVSKKLDEELYGMDNVKEEILIFLNAKIQNPEMKKCSLGLIGPPGSGKTIIAQVLAEALDFPFGQIFLGGIKDPAVLKGHQYTYIGSQPGAIVQCLKRMKHKNGILFLDEYDKILNPDVCSTLLQITDSSQNSKFRDTFLDGITLDLSYLWFVYSMNELPSDSAIRDRVFTIRVNGYNHDDKVNIIKDYMLPKALKNINLEPSSVILPRDVASYIVEQVSPDYEKGVRSLEKIINNMVNKITFLKNHQNNRGKIGFNVSFNLGKKIKLPFTFTRKNVDLFMLHTCSVKNKNITIKDERLC